jgi:hypothetical protein
MEYYIFIIYEDETTYEGKISNKKDFDKIPKDKAYTSMRIFYVDKLYSHIIDGNDFVHLDYKKLGNFLVKAHWDENQSETTLVELRGVNKEKIKTKNTKRLKKTFIGKLIDDKTYKKSHEKCVTWRP